MRDKIYIFGKKFIMHELVTGSFYIFLGSMAANIFAFLLNLFLARNLSYADYAIFSSLLSVIIIASVPANSLNTIIVKFATGYYAKNQTEKLKLLYLKFLKFILGVSIFICLLFVSLSIPISNFLRLDNLWYVVLVGVTVAAFYLNVLNGAFLQSLLKFSFISLVTSISGLIKLLVGVVLVYLGFRAFGGLWSIFFMTFVSFLIGFYPLRKIILLKVKNKDILIKTDEIYSYAIPTFVTVLSLTAFTSMDVILVKHFFNPQEAGFYAGLSLIGKVIFYFTAPIPMVMFPLLVKRHSTGKNFKSLFYLALILVLLPSLAITVFYFFFPEAVIMLFLGGRDYLTIAKYLGFFGLYLTIFSLVNVCVNFFLSLNKTKIAPVVVGASILQTVLIYFYHNNFYEIIVVSLAVSTALLIYLLSYYFKNFVVQSS